MARKFNQIEEIFKKVLKNLINSLFCDHIEKISDHKNFILKSFKLIV